jgi:hypothetical protein
MSTNLAGTPVSNATPADRICPTCRIFETEPGADACARCSRRHSIRAGKSDDRRRRLESVSREVRALRLDRIDPDWPSKFLTTDQAARFYHAELAEMDTPI